MRWLLPNWIVCRTRKGGCLISSRATAQSKALLTAGRSEGRARSPPRSASDRVPSGCVRICVVAAGAGGEEEGQQREDDLTGERPRCAHRAVIAQTDGGVSLTAAAPRCRAC